jgi:hypothetical protein
MGAPWQAFSATPAPYGGPDKLAGAGASRTLRLPSIYTLFTLYLPSIYLYLSSIYTLFTLYLPSIYPLFTLYLSSIYTLFTLYLPSIYPPLTSISPSIHHVSPIFFLAGASLSLSDLARGDEAAVTPIQPQYNPNSTRITPI